MIDVSQSDLGYGELAKQRTAQRSLPMGGGER